MQTHVALPYKQALCRYEVPRTDSTAQSYVGVGHVPLLIYADKRNWIRVKMQVQFHLDKGKF